MRSGATYLDFTALTAYRYMIFNLLCAPCFAAMGAIKREMNNGKWTLAAIGYMCGFAYAAPLRTSWAVLLWGRCPSARYSGGHRGAGGAGHLLVRPNKYNADYRKPALSIRAAEKA